MTLATPSASSAGDNLEGLPFQYTAMDVFDVVRAALPEIVNIQNDSDSTTKPPLGDPNASSSSSFTQKVSAIASDKQIVLSNDHHEEGQLVHENSTWTLSTISFDGGNLKAGFQSQTKKLRPSSSHMVKTSNIRRPPTAPSRSSSAQVLHRSHVYPGEDDRFGGPQQRRQLRSASSMRTLLYSGGLDSNGDYASEFRGARPRSREHAAEGRPTSAAELARPHTQEMPQTSVRNITFTWATLPAQRTIQYRHNHNHPTLDGRSGRGARQIQRSLPQSKATPLVLSLPESIERSSMFKHNQATTRASSHKFVRKSTPHAVSTRATAQPAPHEHDGAAQVSPSSLLATGGSSNTPAITTNQNPSLQETTATRSHTLASSESSPNLAYTHIDMFSGIPLRNNGIGVDNGFAKRLRPSSSSAASRSRLAAGGFRFGKLPQFYEAPVLGAARTVPMTSITAAMSGRATPPYMLSPSSPLTQHAQQPRKVNADRAPLTMLRTSLMDGRM